MATTALLQFKDGQVSEGTVYEWCARYCTFRDDATPRTAQDLPIVRVGDAVRIVRHAFLDRGTLRVVLGDLSGNPRLRDLGGSRRPVTAALNSDAETWLATTWKSKAAHIPLLTEGSMVMVTAGTDAQDFIGVGGTDSAPPPNYRIVGTVVRQPEADAKSISIRAFIRGRHFIFGDAPVVEVPILAADEIVHSQRPASRARIAAAIEEAYSLLAGNETKRSAMDVTVTSPENLTVGGTSTTLTNLHEQVQADFRHPELGAYGAAMRRRVMYSYSSADGKDARELDGAIAELARGPLQTKKVLDAARAMRLALFGQAVTQVGSTSTAGFTNEGRATTRGLEGDLVSTQRALNEALRRADVAEQDLARMTQAFEQLSRQRPGDPAIPMPVPGPTVPTPTPTAKADLTAARSRAQALSRKLRELKGMAKRDPSLQGEVDATKAELTAAMREVDRLLG